MKAKEVLIQTTAKVFDVSPDTVEHFFRTTGLWEQPELQEELPEPVQAWFENLNLPLARIFATTLLDRLGVSMNKLEQTMKKG